MNEINLKNIPNPIIEILANRGIFGEDALREYFSIKPKLTYDPFLLKNMKAGVDLILDNINGGRKIVIYGDYDTDGITSTALLLKFLGKLTVNLDYYIPSRIDEGYGLNMTAIEKIHSMGCNLLITVDCGSVSRNEVEYARSLGMDTLVTDHHTLGEVISDGPVINPKQPGDDYPFKELAGVGVAYKLAQGIQRKLGLPKYYITELLDLVAVGTIGDMVSLTDENRTLVKYGIRLIKTGECNKGIMKLFNKSSIDINKINAKEISYGIVPKINAAGRLSDAKIALKLLMAEADEEIEEYGSMLVDINNKRKSLQDDIYKKCIEIVNENHKDDSFLVVNAENAHEGITGIVAGKIKEYFKRPTIIVTNNGEYLKGTGRSIQGVNLDNMLSNNNNLFIKFGGHKAACGFTAEARKLNEIRGSLKEEMDLIARENPLIFQLENKEDLIIGVKDADLNLIKSLELMEPLGSDNEYPVFKINGVLLKDIRFMGSSNEHVRFMAEDKDKNIIQCIVFNNALKYREMLNSSKEVNLLGLIEINEWNNKISLQMKVIDIDEGN